MRVLERAARAIGVTGASLAVSWGVQWGLRAGASFGREEFLQLLFSLLMTMSFVRAARGNSRQWFWANPAFFSAIWVWRCSFKHHPLGVVTFSIAGGLALVGLLIATWRHRAAERKVDPGTLAPERR
jgi:hypothetical protein